MRDHSERVSAADHDRPTLEQEVEEVERTERAIQESQREAVKSQNLFNLLMVTTNCADGGCHCVQCLGLVANGTRGGEFAPGFRTSICQGRFDAARRF